jgi:hypothetical protein
VALLGLILGGITVTLVVQAAGRLDTLMLAQVALVTRQPLQALLILMPCKVSPAGLMLLLLMVMQLPVVEAVPVGQGVALQELLFPVAGRLAVLALFLHCLAVL